MSPSVGSLITDMLDQSGDEGGKEGLILVNIPVLFPLPLRGCTSGRFTFDFLDLSLC